ncbi:MAG: hypothetical protein ACLGJC_09065 [Alphaproteobacteria bacterium]
MSRRIRIIPAVEAHAAQRLNERYGLAYTPELKRELFARISAGRANDNRHPQACLVQQDKAAERWIVAVGNRPILVVINRSSPPTVATFLCLHGKPRK